MDKMRARDLSIMLKYIEYSDATAWDRTRNIMLSVLKPYLKKKNLTATELWPLPIDNIDEGEHTTEVDKEKLDWWINNKDKFTSKKAEN